MSKLEKFTRLILLDIACSKYVTHRLRLSIYRLLGANIGEGVIIERGCYFSNSDLSTIEVKDNVFINHRNYFDNNGYILIDSNTAIAMNNSFITTTHDLSKGDSTKRVRGNSVILPIYIGKGNWIGANCVFLPGSFTMDGCVVGANSLITSSGVDKSNSLWYNSKSSAKFIKDLYKN